MKILVSVLLWAYVICIQAPAAPSDTTAQFDRITGLFTIKHHTVDIAKANFIFSSGGGVWSGPRIASDKKGPFDYVILGELSDGGISLNGSASRTESNRMEWLMRIGRGAGALSRVSFKFQLAPFADETFVPQLDILPAKVGWSLRLAADEQPIKLILSPAPSGAILEHGEDTELIVQLEINGDGQAAREFTMTLELPVGSDVVPSAEDRLEPPVSSWYVDLLDASNSPVDLSFLNDGEKPAGKRGMLGVRDGRLVFADGTVARFWGANITAAAIFQTGLSDTVKQARRLSKLGFNLVRIHHFDSDWVKPNIIASETGPSVEINGEALRRLDWWIKALGDEGIYVEVDLNVGRIMSPALLANSEEILSNGSEPTAKGFAYLNSQVEARMREFNRLLLEHVNPYTKLAYADDPRIAFLLLTNENDLTHHFGHMFLPDKRRPKHSQLYMREAALYADKKGLDPDATWKSWIFGSSKLFLNELEHRFNLRMIKDIRTAGSRALIITTGSWGNMTAAGLPALSDGDVIAVHSYGESGLLETDPRYKPNLSSWMAAGGLAGKPLTVPEWNVAPYPSYDRSSLPGYVAAIASFQDWSALAEYAYSQSSLDETRRANQWEMASDPSLLGMMPVGALIYRRQDVKPGKIVHYFSPEVGDFINNPLSPKTSRAMRTLTERWRWRIALPNIKELDWFKPWIPDNSEVRVSNKAESFVGEGEDVCAETLEFCRNWRKGTFIVDTPMTQLASGWIGGEIVKLKNAAIALETANAALAIQSLDSKAITESRSILISMAGQTLPAQGGVTSIRSEPIVGRVTFKAGPGLAAFASFGDGRTKLFNVQYDNGEYSLHLDAGLGTYWILFRDE